MSTVNAKLKYLWTAEFADGSTIEQPEDDRYSKHDDSAEWNPSAFRDILEHPSELVRFTLGSISIDMLTGVISISGTDFKINDEDTKRKLIFYRDIERTYVDGVDMGSKVVSYSVGYEYKDNKGKVHKRIMRITS